MQQVSEVQHQEIQEYAVSLPDFDRIELLSLFRSDENYDEISNTVISCRVDIDEEGRTVNLSIEAAASSVDEASRAGEGLARCLSNEALVSRSDGTVVDDYGTPYGALYKAWSLNIRITGEAGSEELVLDGWLPAGADTMTWQ